jgi:hypothetical protein
MEGALAASMARRQPRVDQQRGVRRATHALDDTQLPAQALLEGDTGQAHAERGVRFLKDPRFLAASRYRKKPERSMALLMVMTVCVLVYAALEYRIRTALNEPDATVPHQTGQLLQHPTARWGFQSCVGMHLRLTPGRWPVVRKLTEEHQRLLRLLGKPDEQFYSSIFMQTRRVLRNVGTSLALQAS